MDLPVEVMPLNEGAEEMFHDSGGTGMANVKIYLLSFTLQNFRRVGSLQRMYSSQIGRFEKGIKQSYVKQWQLAATFKSRRIMDDENEDISLEYPIGAMVQDILCQERSWTGWAKQELHSSIMKPNEFLNCMRRNIGSLEHQVHET